MRPDRSPRSLGSPSPPWWVPVSALLLLVLGQPGLAAAHGDDTVTVATFYGPLLAAGVILLVVPLGKALLRLAPGRR
ncbi:MAG: hypothetical protein ACREKF_09535 [Candidatus Methylomirabilales bacterium]